MTLLASQHRIAHANNWSTWKIKRKIFWKVNLIFISRIFTKPIFTIVVFSLQWMQQVMSCGCNPDSKVHGANMGPIWGRQDPGGPHVGPMKLVIWEVISCRFHRICHDWLSMNTDPLHDTSHYTTKFKANRWNPSILTLYVLNFSEGT